jgi:hypothetical protein
MKRWLFIFLAAGFLLSPVVARAADPDQSSANQNPPVEQALVREGDFAIKLAAELNLGNTEDEATAEALLVSAGIAPKNGWISDYPVTPQIVGQLHDAIAQAAADGTLSDAYANQDLDRVVAQMNLPEPAGTETADVAVAPSDSTVINNYYESEGPPIVTYYPPPAAYLYLYDWVPYPVYWYGFWFPGYYICQNFTTTVVVTSSFGHPHGHPYGPYGPYPRRGIVSNWFRDPGTGKPVSVNPVVRSRTGVVRPVMTLREDGRSLMILPGMRQRPIISGMSLAGNRAGYPHEDRDRLTTHSPGRIPGSTMLNRSVGRTSAPQLTERPAMRNFDNPGYIGRPMMRGQARTPGSTMVNRSVGRTPAARPAMRNFGNPRYNRTETSRPMMRSQTNLYRSVMTNSRSGMTQPGRFTGYAAPNRGGPGFSRGGVRPGRG